MKKLLILALCFGVAVACHKEPSASEFDGEFMVYTAHSDNVQDFSVYNTFTVADSLLYIEGSRGVKSADSWALNIREQYISTMKELGYEYVDTGKMDDDLKTEVPGDPQADLGIQISYIVSTDYFTAHMPYDPYWWYGYPGYWYPGYWGNWGGWYYSFPVTYSYSTQSLLTEMVDLTVEEGDDRDLPVVWNSYIDGNIGNTSNDKARFSRAIAQSFAQSGYLGKN